MISESEKHDSSPGAQHHEESNLDHKDAKILPIEQEAHHDAYHVNLSWRSWLVVFITCFAIFAQIFVVVAAGSVITFIIRDLGDASIAGWVIQGPLLMQSVLSPIVGRLSDVLDRKYLATVPPIIAFIGAVISAKATSMSMLIGGGILIGTTLSTISIVQAIPSEILPLKYRALANGFAFMGGALGGLIGSLGAGAVTNVNTGGWRYIFWMQAAFHGITALGLLGLYWPPKNIEYPKMSLQEYIWACDPIGSLLFVASATLMLLALDWAGGAYTWSDRHVAVPLSLGLALLVLFTIYEWKGRPDGLVAHIFFRKNLNFVLSVFAFAVEGWIFYSAVNSVVPQIVLNLGFETNAWRISVRQLSYQVVTLIVSIPIVWYSTRYKDLQSPLLLTFTLFLVVAICYATIQPSWDKAQIGLNVIAAVGQSGPLALLVACVQFTAPHAYLSTATGLAFSARAIGGAFGSGVLNAIINGRLSTHYAAAISKAATTAGLSSENVPALLEALDAGEIGTADVPGATTSVWAAVMYASQWEYAHAYRLAWASIIPFVVFAIVSVACLKGVQDLMTEKVEATVEHAERMEEKGVSA
ncbi:major facilitator superfamily domain-containing protein [Pseudomassariella vexata]|uniref:Major facilitator superfamily domain-containing protein n=1 Tax=Pseudomassariella vexata TaxID=1141098 RepID=A0A1Y2DCL1_9PEZI|nr:major facilitator superfamily domain-containing protein [Pseudomassariella vexata]ORY57013.1 major facilitator superfamily domain-containing protein [Pseudomassariella vexata]